MTPIEIMALVVVVLGLFKLIVMGINPGSWIHGVESLLKRPKTATIISLVLGAVVLNYLLMEITIVQVFASIMFVIILGLIGLATFSKEFLDFARKISKEEDLMKRAWLITIIWLALMLWVLYTLFM
ncbi:hypothetical protein KY321_05770 [Candidatus Woesearchaeota archaeon]|nr:hypothetical protein [Candidatus Woesearchaeota archaeon]